ncbi:hypothetical protein PR048_000697 [Dryococelus australis]|uniref:Endonuclease/exonuclease/phosphatase domain-containing protein n=1 Tax=Dryococelus australis TaxID=614101 RepID=A0ABQ9IFC6_9NEOP|nr:hypothetical protein PR048_000697 [Dryococelus australis]
MGSPPNGDVVLSSPATRGFQRVPPPQLTLRRALATLFLPILTVYRLVAHINSESLMRHIDEVRRIFTPFSMHAILISQSWLKPSLSPMLVSLSGYKILLNDRINKGGGGGVVIYSPSEYAGKPEFIITELKIPPTKVLLAIVYRPPKATDLSDFEEALSNLIAGYEHCIIMGDFSINFLSNTNEANKLLTTLSCMNITVCPFGAIHHTAWIDLMFMSKPKLILTHGQTAVPDLKNIDTDKLNSDAALMQWHEINTRKFPVSVRCTDLYNRTVPLRTRRLTKPPAPWLTNDIAQLMRKRDNAYSRYKRDI